MTALGILLPALLGAVLDLPAGGDLAATLGRARDGDVVRLGPGLHAGTLGRVRTRGALRIEGAGPGRTEVVAPEGEDGLVVEDGEASLAGLSLRAGPGRCALKLRAGRARLDDVVLSGGACGAFVEGGRLEAHGVDLAGDYGLLARTGAVVLDGGSARGTSAGLAVLSGSLSVRGFAVTGPSREAGITISGGSAELERVVVRAPGPSGLAVTGSAQVRGTDVEIAGATEEAGFLGDCVQVRRGRVELAAGALLACAGAAVEASGGEVTLRGMELVGGAAGGVILLDGAKAELAGNRCGGHGPGLVATTGAHAIVRSNRWRTDPVLWVDCGSGARVEIGRGETLRQPCAPPR